MLRNRRAAYALAVWLLLLAGLTWWDSSQQPPSTPNKASQQTSSHRSDATVALVSDNERIADYTHALATWTTVLGVATIFLWLTTIVIGIVQHRDTNDALRISRDSADAAKNAANAAQAGAQTAEKALTVVERPYIFIRDVRMENVNGTSFIITLQNYGRTPCVLEMIGTLIRWQINFKSFEEPTDHVMYKPLSEGDKHEELIHPHQFQGEPVSAIEDDRGLLFITVSFEYRDIFGKKRSEKVPLFYFRQKGIFVRHQAYPHETTERKAV